jgi:hypothetical protein
MQFSRHNESERTRACGNDCVRLTIGAVHWGSWPASYPPTLRSAALSDWRHTEDISTPCQPGLPSAIPAGPSESLKASLFTFIPKHICGPSSRRWPGGATEAGPDSATGKSALKQRAKLAVRVHAYMGAGGLSCLERPARTSARRRVMSALTSGRPAAAAASASLSSWITASRRARPRRSEPTSSVAGPAPAAALAPATAEGAGPSRGSALGPRVPRANAPPRLPAPPAGDPGDPDAATGARAAPAGGGETPTGRETAMSAVGGDGRRAGSLLSPAAVAAARERRSSSCSTRASTSCACRRRRRRRRRHHDH